MLSLQMKDISSKQGEQAKLLYTFKVTYDKRLDNMRTNNKISTKFEIGHKRI